VGESPMVALATAHPAKFPDAVERATGRRPDVPERLAAVLDRPERFETLPAEVAAVRAHVLAATV
jgi:threonine synthase